MLFRSRVSVVARSLSCHDYLPVCESEREVSEVVSSRRDSRSAARPPALQPGSVLETDKIGGTRGS